MVTHTLNPSTREAEVGISMSLRLAWSTELVPGQLGLLQRKTVSGKIKEIVTVTPFLVIVCIVSI